MNYESQIPYLLERWPHWIEQLYAKGEITMDMRDHFVNQFPADGDELEACYHELNEAIQNKQYYQLLARIEKAEIVIEQEQDMKKRDFYVKKMRELADQLERMRTA